MTLYKEQMKCLWSVWFLIFRVVEQGGMLNKIEDQVSEAGQFIDDGVEDLLEARDVRVLWLAAEVLAGLFCQKEEGLACYLLLLGCCGHSFGCYYWWMCGSRRTFPRPALLHRHD